MNKFCGLLVLLIVAALSACSMPGTRIYTVYMSGEREARNIESSASVAINIHSEDYLKQPYIALRSSPYQLTISKYSKWGSSPHRIVRREFKKALLESGVFTDVRVANIPFKDYYLLKINLKRFEQVDNNDKSVCRLEFDVNFLSPEGIELYSASISGEDVIKGRGFAGLAEGLSRLLEQGIDESTAHIYESLIKRAGFIEEEDYGKRASEER